MKQGKKVLSVVLAILLTFGTILSPLSMSVEAQDTTDTSNSSDLEYRLILDIQQMTGSLGTSFPFSYSNYNCMTNNPQIVASAGYTNVVTYCADADGYLRVDDLKVWIGGSDYTTTDREVEFAVVDDSGVILTNQGDIVVINSDNYMKSGLSAEAIEVKKGANLHFVFHGNVGYANSPRCNAKIMYSSDGENWSQKNSTGLLWASTNTNASAAQGVENFYYNYSTTYKKEAIAQDSVGIVYKEMEGSRSGFPFMYDDMDCMTNVPEIIVSKGFTNVVAYQMPSDGQIKLDALKVSIANTDLSTKDRAFEFAVVDKSGKVLSNDGKIAVVNSTTSSVSGMAVEALELKAGEKIYFVFYATAGTTNSLRCSANIMLSTDGTTWSQASQFLRSGEYILWPANTTAATAEQGKDNFYYGYSEIYVKHEYTAPSTQEPDNPSEPIQPTIPGTATVPVANEEGYLPTYKINMEVADMTVSTAHSQFPLAMPDKAWDCMTNPSGNQIVSEGYANVLTYQVQEAGKITLKNMRAGISSDTAVVLFAVTDKEGNIIYPADQTFVVLDKDHKSVEGTFLQDYKVAVGDEIRFIFEGVEGKTTACWVRGIMVHYDSVGKETRLTREDGGYIAPISGSIEQGADGFHYQYAKTFENVQTGYVTPPPPDVIPGTATVPVANGEGLLPTYKINFEAENMVSSTVHKSFPWSMPEKEYDCMTNPTGNKVVSPGYMNITTYVAQKSGTISLKNMTASLYVKDKSSNHVVLFAVTDKEGNIIYPTDGTLVVLNKDNAKIAGTWLKDYKVEKGDEINFIFQGVAGKTASCWISGIITYYDSTGTETRLTREDGLIAPISGSTDQGADGFYYRYAKTFENVQTGYATPPAPEVLPGYPTVPVANAQGLVPKYKINFEAADMVASTVHKDFPLSMPDKEYHCMTNPSGNQIVSKGYANILTYTAQKSGKLTLKNMTASITVKNAPENVVLFAISDKDGNILYPSDGTMVVLNKDNESVTGTFLSQFEVKKGDELNFIFQGVEGKTIACRVRGIMLYIDSEGKETRLTREDGGYIAPISKKTAQGADGFSYRYAKKFENVILGYVPPKNKAVQWGEAIQVVVSNNPDDFVYYETTTDGEATKKVDMLEIIKPGVELRYKYIPWIIIAVSGVVFGTQWVVFFITRRKGVKQNEENS